VIERAQTSITGLKIVFYILLFFFGFSVEYVTCDGRPEFLIPKKLDFMAWIFSWNTFNNFFWTIVFFGGTKLLMQQKEKDSQESGHQ
jgi:hypothetical protein